MSWSGLQQEALEAMGFAVLMPRPAPGSDGRIAAAEPVVGDLAAAAAARVPATSSPPAERASGPSAAAHAAAAAPRAEPRAEPGAEPRRLAAPQDRLARALLRAAGRAPDAVDASALLAQWPDPAHLRRDPAAKRALWPRLRALRRADA